MACSGNSYFSMVEHRYVWEGTKCHDELGKVRLKTLPWNGQWVMRLLTKLKSVELGARCMRTERQMELVWGAKLAALQSNEVKMYSTYLEIISWIFRSDGSRDINLGEES